MRLLIIVLLFNAGCSTLHRSREPAQLNMYEVANPHNQVLSDDYGDQAKLEIVFRQDLVVSEGTSSFARYKFQNGIMIDCSASNNTCRKLSLSDGPICELMFHDLRYGPNQGVVTIRKNSRLIFENLFRGYTNNILWADVYAYNTGFQEASNGRSVYTSLTCKYDGPGPMDKLTIGQLRATVGENLFVLFRHLPHEEENGDQRGVAH